MICELEKTCIDYHGKERPLTEREMVGQQRKAKWLDSTYVFDFPFGITSQIEDFQKVIELVTTKENWYEYDWYNQVWPVRLYIAQHPDVNIVDYLNSCIKEAETIKTEWEAERKAYREKEDKRRDDIKSSVQVRHVYKNQKPRGGEDGVDGYYDADFVYIPTGETIRFVYRNVFDFGAYGYPKRVEGTDDVFNSKDFTEAEKAIDKYIQTFSPFTNEIRM